MPSLQQLNDITFDTIRINLTTYPDGSCKIVASPHAPFCKHLRWVAGRNDLWLVHYKHVEPQSACMERGDSLVFMRVDPAEMLPLVQTLNSVAQFNHQLRKMLGELQRTLGGFVEDDALHIHTPLGQVDVIHESDVLCVFAEPLHKVFGPRIRLDENKEKVLTYGEETFFGLEDAEDDGQFMFTFRYPEDDTRIRRLVTALAQILFAAEEQRRA